MSTEHDQETRGGYRRVEPTKSLLQGGAYTHSSQTDLRARFERMKAEAEDVKAWADGTSVFNPKNRLRMRA